MNGCTHFLVILSAASTSARWVLDEIAMAERRHRVDAGFGVSRPGGNDVRLPRPVVHRELMCSPQGSHQNPNAFLRLLGGWLEAWRLTLAANSASVLRNF